MITVLNKFSDLKKYDRYHLCFIDEIPETVLTYTKFAKEIMSKPDYVPGTEYLDTTETPNPEYIPGESELHAYFTPLPLDEQTGEDWDYSPYTESAELPDDEDVEILCVKFAVHSYSYVLPSAWGHDRSAFNVYDINGGAVAWIFDRNVDTNKSTAIYAGVNPEEFFEKLSEIEAINPDWEPDMTYERHMQ